MIYSLLLIASLFFAHSTPAASASSTTPILKVAAVAPDSEPEAASTTLPDGFDTGRGPFEVRFGDESIPYRVMAAFVLPGQDVPLEVLSGETGFEVRSEAGTLQSRGPNRWNWRAPEASGVYPVEVASEQGRTVTLNVFVMEPYDRMRHGILDGYDIGEYPTPRRNQPAAFQRPPGFVKVTAENHDLLVSPHFHLDQFVCKSGAGYPKFVVLQPRLLVKLERLLETANEHGVETNTFHLMSAYRTPDYNRAIGNVTSFSRHHYGDAADIFVDVQPADGRMDDLNHDGRYTSDDARVLGEWADEMDHKDELVGGMSTYGPTETHGPFVHVDARGYAARW